MSLRTLSLFTLLLCSSAIADIAGPGYFRYPTLHQDTLVFTAEGDLWAMQLNQTDARRLTTHAAQETQASISTDGKQVAFVANYEGAPEVYVMPIGGGVAKRVTFENDTVKLHQWTQNGQILYSTTSRVGPTRTYVLYLVDPKSLSKQAIPLADAVEGVIDANGEYVYFVRFGLQLSSDNANHYQGGGKGELWRYKLGSRQEAEHLSAQHQGSIRTPMLHADRLYFVSNQDGIDNVWSTALDGSDLQKVTNQSDWTVRGADINQGRLVFQSGADLYLRELASAQQSKLSIKLSSDFPHLREHWDNKPLKLINSTRFAGNGEKVVITARGRIAIAGADKSRLVEIATAPNSRSRHAVLSHDGKWVYALNDASGELEIWRFAADGSNNAKQLTNNANELRWNIYLSPDDNWLAFDDLNGDIWLLDLTKEKSSRILSGNTGLFAIPEIVWSPDSQFLAITRNLKNQDRSRVQLYDIASEKAQILTSEKYQSYSPTFSPDSKWLYFLSERHFKAFPGNPWRDRNMGTGFDRRANIFAYALTEDEAFPFRQPNELDASQPEKTNSKQDKGEQKQDVNLAWKGMQGRLWQVPIKPGNYSSLAMNDKFLFVVDQINEPEQKPHIKSISVAAEPKVENFTDKVAQFSLSKDGKKLFVRKQGSDNQNMFIVDAAAKFPKDSKGKKVVVAPWKLRISPQQEWQQIFHDAWLLHRDSFFDKAMRGLDWPQVKAKYQPLIARATDRHEVNDIFKQMTGELNALHSQVRGGDTPIDADAPKAASLGAVYQETKNGLVISHIYRHDLEVPDMAGPLSKPGVDAKIGDIIEKINGQNVNSKADLVNALLNQAKQQVLLDLKRGREQLKTIAVAVDTGKDFRLRYQDWVQGNTAVVTEQDDNIGYFHLYSMTGRDAANFAREFYAQYRKDGLIIDVRRNRGGNIDSWILEKLMRKVWMFWQNTNDEVWLNMQQTFRGHLVVLADQFTYSDGETFTAGIRALNLAPVIGKQTAGAGVWLSGRNRAADGGIARVAEFPVYAAADGRWLTEANGIKPDIEVDNLPYATFNGEDAQLQAAISYLQKKMREQPVPELKAKPFPPLPQPANDIKL